MRIGHQLFKVVFCIFLLTNIGCKSREEATKNDSNAEEWTALFNGKDLSDWEIKMAGHPLNENYKETFVAEDGMIRVRYNNYVDFEDTFGHMYYKTPYSYYKLRFDYRFYGEQLKGGVGWNIRNSGFMLHSQSAPSNELNQEFPVSVELQLLGGLGDGKERPTANVCTPGTTITMNDAINFEHCISSSSKTYHGDQWVHVEAIVKGGESMTFMVENDTVLRFQKPRIDKEFVSFNTKKKWEDFGVINSKNEWIAKAENILTEGYIALQAESHQIDFKNIELLDLCGCMDPKAKNYKSYYVKSKPERCKY